MDNRALAFATVSENKVITRIGRSTILQPKSRFKGSSIKWFDDNKLLKRNKA